MVAKRLPSGKTCACGDALVPWLDSAALACRRRTDRLRLVLVRVLGYWRWAKGPAHDRWCGGICASGANTSLGQVSPGDGLK